MEIYRYESAMESPPGIIQIPEQTQKNHPFSAFSRSSVDGGRVSTCVYEDQIHRLQDSIVDSTDIRACTGHSYIFANVFGQNNGVVLGKPAAVDTRAIDIAVGNNRFVVVAGLNVRRAELPLLFQ